MNTDIEHPPTDDLLFDQLVDGQLNERQRYDLLSSLEDEPDGWRRCALAFLEAQCWKQALGAIVQGNAPLPEQAPATLPRRSPWPGRLLTATAMAASFFAALWLGWWVQREGIGPRGVLTDKGGTGELAQNVGPQPHLPPAGRTDTGQAKSTPRVGGKPWRVVNVSSPGRNGEPGHALNFPAVEREGIDEQWVQSVPSAVPENVREALARTGHKIKQRRELVPVPLRDGRQLVMPVDRVDVHYVGNGPY